MPNNAFTAGHPKPKTDPNALYVLKRISLKRHRGKHLAGVKEAKIMSKLDHPNIVKLLNSFVEGKYLFILMEYAARGDLCKLVAEHKAKGKYISEQDIWRFASQILAGVQYMHSMQVMHRDIKCLNIFLTDDKKLKIGDLGVAEVLKQGFAFRGKRLGTPMFMSPEQVKNQQYGHKIDCWAAGCSLYHLACLEPPFTGETLAALGNSIQFARPKPLPPVYSRQLIAFIEALLQKLP